jgi:hydroxypyruvate reductase/glycerate 2-kinase
LDHLKKGADGEVEEMPKNLPSNVHNLIIANNAIALDAAKAKAKKLGYSVFCLSSADGETQRVAKLQAHYVFEAKGGTPFAYRPTCFLSGGETTVTLGKDHGLGGRNQEFVLAALKKLGRKGMANVVVLSGGTDGEDGPTDAAGAIADADTLTKADQLGLSPGDFLRRNDAYHFFQATGDLLKTGLTETNVMDVRVILIAASSKP